MVQLRIGAVFPVICQPNLRTMDYINSRNQISKLNHRNKFNEDYIVPQLPYSYVHLPMF